MNLSFGRLFGAVVRLAVCALLASAGAPAQVALQRAEAALPPFGALGKPNVIVLMFDDLDVASLDKMLSLPSDVPGQDVMMYYLKKYVVDAGFTFSQSFVSNSLCCPSRATFLTGKYSHNHHVYSNSPPSGGVAGLDDASTLATWLKGAGYWTGYIGKYLNGYGSWNETNAMYIAGQPAPDRRFEQTYRPPGWDKWAGLIDPFTYDVYDYRLNDNGVPRDYGSASSDYQTDVLRGYAEAFVRDALTSHSAQPFFLAVMPLAPHVERSTLSEGDTLDELWRMSIRPAPRHKGTVPAPATPDYAAKPAFNEADTTDKPYWRPQLDDADQAALKYKYQARLESIRAVDDLLGGVVAALGPAIENTVIIVTSDNGYMLGEHRMPEKLAAYEESIRVPLYVRMPLRFLQAWGGTGYARRTSNDLALNNDLAPTIAALADVAAPGADGRSLVPALQAAMAGTPAPNWRKRFLVEHWWRDNPFERDIPTFAAVRNGPVTSGPNTLYVEYYDQKGLDVTLWDRVILREFYNLATDPAQLTNAPGSATPGLTTQLRSLRACGSATGQQRCAAIENA